MSLDTETPYILVPKRLRCRCFHLLVFWACLLVTGAMSAVIVVFVFIVRPYRNGDGFTQTSCNVINVTRFPEEQTCTCGNGCVAANICWTISVTFLDGEKDVGNAVLKQDEGALTNKV